MSTSIAEETVLKCPICRKHPQRWAPGGTPGKNKMFCPHCKSKSRHRMLWLFLRENGLLPEAPDRPDWTILHVAPEEGLMRKFIRKFGGENYVGSDINGARPGVTHSFSIEDIPFPDRHFRIVVCNHVLEHVDDDLRAVREFARVLREDGCVLVTIPVDGSRSTTFEDQSIVDPELRTLHFGQHDHVRAYGRDASERLGRGGLRVAALSGAEIAGAGSRRYGIKGGELLFVLTP